MVKFSQAVCKI